MFWLDDSVMLIYEEQLFVSVNARESAFHAYETSVKGGNGGEKAEIGQTGRDDAIKKEREATGRYSHQSSCLGHNVSISLRQGSVTTPSQP